MKEFYKVKNTFYTAAYGLIRVGLGLYLLQHAVVNVLDFDSFINESDSYVPDTGLLSYLGFLVPIVPLIEFFIAGMIMLGIYTKISLKWAIGLGAFFVIYFHLVQDYQAALIHMYTMIIKIVLLYTIAYNKWSLDYYNIWSVSRDQNKTVNR